jgi:hypothetical protein
MTEPNCFYRMLLIGCITSHHALTKDTRHLPLLETTVDDLVADIDASPFGLIDDYPGQCFPADVACCIAMIERASKVVGKDRGQWAKRALGRMMSNFPEGLPAYTADSATGLPQSPSRGCTNGFFFTYSSKIVPSDSPVWYRNYAD